MAIVVAARGSERARGAVSSITMHPMFQWLRDWWTLKSKSAFSPEYEAAMERRMPGFGATQKKFATSAKQRRRLEEQWWPSVVALQEAGEIERAAKETEANAEELSRFVLEPFERLGMLYSREVDRLLARNDLEGAGRAAHQANWWMSVWASHATSGGEGTARSAAAAEMQRDLARRVPDLSEHPKT
jgi:hypothetical protein